MDTETIIKIIEQFLEQLSIEATNIGVEKQGELVVFNIETPESELLIGKDGENLRSMGYLLGHIVSQKAGYHTKFNIDVNGYRKKEIDNLKAEAAKIADEVRMSKVDSELRPMSSFERMVVHNMFTDDSEIETESVGEDSMRRIVLRAKSV